VRKSREGRKGSGLCNAEGKGDLGAINVGKSVVLPQERLKALFNRGEAVTGKKRKKNIVRTQSVQRILNFS